jgi:hypothetical protein
VIWFQEIRFLTELSTNKDAEKRRIILHKGLNILWARPEDTQTDQALYGDGLAGHASGKTLFCRFLRHILGEATFGTTAQHKAIAENFASLWVVAEVHVNGESWVVGRPLTSGGSDFAVKSDFIDTVLAHGTPQGGFREFSAAVKASAGMAGESLYPGDGWRHLMPWLTRDQESRFASLAAWRESSSEGDNPQTKSIERHILMRAALDLLDLREPVLRAAVDSDLAKLETGTGTTSRLQTDCKSQWEVAESAGRELVGEPAPETREKLETRVSSMIEVLRERHAQLERQPESPALAAARLKFEEAREKVAAAEREIENLGDRIEDKENQQKRDLSIVRNIRNGNVEDPAREAKNWCPKTIQVARERGCVEQGTVSTESATNLAELEAKANALTAEINGFKTKRSEFSRSLPALKTAHVEVRMALEAATRFANRDISTLGTNIERANGVFRLLQQAAKTEKSLEAHLEAMKKLEEGIDMDAKRLAFGSVFADIMRAVMGDSIETDVSIDANGINPHAKRKGELSGAALDTIKTLAFDLAAVVSSIEGVGSHPRFLIHDGPREGDMARIIYERFFVYAAGIEKAFSSPENASFQYIITTTTNPPKAMQEGSRWLLLPVLNSLDKNTRLLGVDF